MLFVENFTNSCARFEALLLQNIHIIGFDYEVPISPKNLENQLLFLFSFVSKHRPCDFGIKIIRLISILKQSDANL